MNLIMIDLHSHLLYPAKVCDSSDSSDNSDNSDSGIQSNGWQILFGKVNIIFNVSTICIDAWVTTSPHSEPKRMLKDICGMSFQILTNTGLVSANFAS